MASARTISRIGLLSRALGGGAIVQAGTFHNFRNLTRDQEISTQQAAEILGLSRPAVVRLVEDGELHAHVPGAVRRKLRLADVLSYREELRERRNRFIAESSAEFGDIDESEVADLLDEVRRND